MAEDSSLKSKPGSKSRIPRLQRSSSFHGELRKSTNTNNVHRETEEDANEAEDDFGSLSSVGSIKSCAGFTSAYRRAVETAADYRNKGNPKYALHCSYPSNGYSNQGEYLTPTQRANRTIRQLKTLLKESEANNCYKDFEIQRLTRELVDLRLKQAQICVNKSEGASETEMDTIRNHLTTPSLADSGHFDELSSQTSQLKDSHGGDKDVFNADSSLSSNGSSCFASSVERNRGIHHLNTQKIEELVKQHNSEMQEVRARFTDRLEMAVTQVSDANARYASLLMNYDRMKDELKQAESAKICSQNRVDELERQNSQLRMEFEDRETREYESQEKLLIQIEALNEEINKKNQDIVELESKLAEFILIPPPLPVLPENDNPSRCDTHESRFDLPIDLEQVASILSKQEQTNFNQSTIESQDVIQEKEISSSSQSPDSSFILKFLRSAIFYFLTDSENGSEHLRAIQGILEFTAEERCAVERAARQGYYL